MDSDFSYLSLVILVIAIQVLILGLVGLFFLFRSSSRSKSESSIKTFLVQHTRQTSIVGGSLIGVVFVGISIYYFTTPDRYDETKPMAPISKCSSPMTPAPSHYKGEYPSDSTAPKRPKESWKSEIKYGDSRIREITRKAIKGELPSYTNTIRQPNPALHTYLSLTNRWLEDKDFPENEPHDAKSFYDRLVKDYGFRGSESTVKSYLKRTRRAEASDLGLLLPIDPSCGQEAKVDWGARTAVLNGKDVDLHVFSMQSKWSGKCFVCCYAGAQLDDFIDAHIRAFEFFGGIFPTLVYVSLPAAMERELRNNNSTEHDSFARFCAYYNISPRFREPGEEQQKGDKKGCPHNILRKSMVSSSGARTLDELNRSVLQGCISDGDYLTKGHTRTISELFEEEKICLLAFPKYTSKGHK